MSGAQADEQEAREWLNETMIALQSAVATHLCDRIHDADVRGEDPCAECVESAADLLGDSWDERIIQRLYLPGSPS